MRHWHGKEEGLARWHKTAGNTVCLSFLDVVSQILSWGPGTGDKISSIPVSRIISWSIFETCDPIPAPEGIVTVYHVLFPSSLSSVVPRNDSPLFNFYFHFTRIDKADLDCIKTLSVPESGWKNEENNVSLDKKKNQELLKCWLPDLSERKSLLGSVFSLLWFKQDIRN